MLRTSGRSRSVMTSSGGFARRSRTSSGMTAAWWTGWRTPGSGCSSGVAMPTAEERANQREDEFDVDEQRRDAYTRGTAVRVAKARLKKELKAMRTVEGLFLVADIIE